MRYFRIEDDFDNVDRWHLGEPKSHRKGEIDPRSFTMGIKYKGPEDLQLGLNSGSAPLDFTLGSFDMPVVRTEIAERIHTLAPDEIQRIPITIVGQRGQFDVVNILTLRKAINERLSEISRWTKEDGVSADKVGKYFGIGKLVLTSEHIQNSRIFRLEGWELPFIVCEEIKDDLENMNVSGITFLELLVV